MILSWTWRCTEIKLFVLHCACVQVSLGSSVICVLWWQLKRERMFANLYSYLIWNECHSHSLLVTATGVNLKAKWTNRWLVCEPLCLQGLSVLLLIRLIMHPESILQSTADWSRCTHVSVCLPACTACCLQQSHWLIFLWDPHLSWKCSAFGKEGDRIC